MRHVRVKRNDTPVMFVAAEADPRVVADAAQRAFGELESRLGALRGRRFFGVFNPTSSEYLACVQTMDADEPSTLGLSEAVIPGGAYLRATLTGPPPAVYAQIAPAFEELEKHADADPSRPLVEFGNTTRSTCWRQSYRKYAARSAVETISRASFAATVPIAPAGRNSGELRRRSETAAADCRFG